ncbi:sugar nucleotide-binding protein [Alphaproteobacteria bacterium]|nr:sugar nucleotide-binding protein [Alphaproteobacteria bacterium]
MRIIILGYTSFVGRALSDYFRSIKDVELLHVGREDSNLHKVIKFEVVNDIKLLDNAVSNLIDSLDLKKNSVVINCISMGDLDKCELNQEDCEMENYHFVKILYNHLKSTNFKKLINFSSNAVYSGNNPPYNEQSECAPINFYGKVKLKMDQYLLGQGDARVVVARPITMYGRVPYSDKLNPVSMIISNLRDGRKMRLTNDVIVNLLYVGDLVKTIEKILDIDFSGLINISGNKEYSRYDLGMEIVELLNIKENLIEPITSLEFNDIASRPLNTSFDNALMRSVGVHPRTLRQVIKGF